MVETTLLFHLLMGLLANPVRLAAPVLDLHEAVAAAHY
jgi:hypothetical protein